jgi:hypothetical protein
MKSYDYCSRGVPVVATAGHLEHSSDAPPHTALVRGAVEMAAAMVAADDEPSAVAQQRIAWAAARTWRRRTVPWLAAALGQPVSDMTDAPTVDLDARPGPATAPVG